TRSHRLRTPRAICEVLLDDRELDRAGGDVARLPGGKRESQLGLTDARFLGDPHGAVENTPSANLVEGVEAPERRRPGVWGRELDFHDRVGAWRKQRHARSVRVLAADHGPAALGRVEGAHVGPQLRRRVTTAEYKVGWELPENILDLHPQRAVKMCHRCGI